MKLSKLSAALMLAGVVTGCGGGSSSGDSPKNPTNPPNPGNQVSVSGSAVKGPLANATVEAYKVDYSADDLIGNAAPVDTGSTNASAEITGLALDPADAPFVLVTTANAGTVDITTNAPPVITTMQTIVTAEQLNQNEPIYATPLTSMAVQVAATTGVSADSFAEELATAQNQVKSTLGFGLDDEVDIFTTPPILTSDTTSTTEQNKVAAYRLAVEAVSAVVANVAEATTATDDNADDILTALAQDLSDGAIDEQSGGEDLAQLVSEQSVADLKIPGTEISVADITTVLADDIEKANIDVELNNDVQVDASKDVVLASDVDFDGVADTDDNCVNVANADQLNANQNSVGAACEAKPQVQNVTSQTLEDTAVTITLLGSDSVPQQNPLIYTVDGQALAAGVAEYSYIPSANASGSFTLNYSVSDGEHSSEPATITITVTPVDDPTTGSVSINGTAADGQTLSISHNLADVDGAVSLTGYQWKAGGTAISGATSSTLTLSQAQVGQQISVDVTHTDGLFGSSTTSSAATSVVANGFDDPASGSVEVAGVAAQNQTLTAAVNLVDPDGPITVQSYQWLADGQAINGENGPSLALDQALVGKDISVRIEYVDSVFSTVKTATSTATVAVADVDDPSQGTVSLQGTAIEDGTLTANVSNISDVDGAIVSEGFVWYADGQVIPGASGASLLLTQAEVGKQIRARFNFNDGQFDSTFKESSLSATVENVNDDPTGVVTISGTAAPGQKLSAANTLDDEDGLGAITYRWSVDDNVVATGLEYLLDETYLGQNIQVAASYQDSYGYQEEVLSNSLLISEDPNAFRVDGNPQEWANIVPVIVDPYGVGDSLGNAGSDIVSLKVHQENGFHYFLVELAGDYSTFSTNTAFDDASDYYLEHYIGINDEWNLDVAATSAEGRSGAKLYSENMEASYWLGDDYSDEPANIDLTSAKFAAATKYIELSVPSAVLGDSDSDYYLESGYYDSSKGTNRYFDWDYKTDPELVGTWKIDSENGQPFDATTYFQFRADGTYTHAETNNDDDKPNGTDGYEIGTFTYYWDEDKGYFKSLAVTQDTNGEWGFSDEGLSSASFVLSDDLNTLTIDDELVMKRVQRDAGIEGAWNVETNEGHDFVAFDSEGEYLYVSTGHDSGNQLEWGTYSFNEQNGELSVVGKRDFNASSGLVNGSDGVDAPATIDTNFASHGAVSLNGSVTATPDVVIRVSEYIFPAVDGATFTYSNGETVTVSVMGDELELDQSIDGEAGPIEIKIDGSAVKIDGIYLAEDIVYRHAEMRNVADENEAIMYRHVGSYSTAAGDFDRVIAIVWLDTNTSANSANAQWAPEAQWGVTSVELMAQGVGPIKVMDFDAATGATDGANDTDATFELTETSLNSSASLSCSTESEWDDQSDGPAEFYSVNQFLSVLDDCDKQSSLPDLNQQDLADLTLMISDDLQESIEFDATAANAVFKDDSETEYGVVTTYQGNIMQILWSPTQGGTATNADLIRIIESGQILGETYYKVKSLYEEFDWSESDGAFANKENKDGELSGGLIITGELLACDLESDWDEQNDKPAPGHFYSIDDFYASVRSCELESELPDFTKTDLANQTLYWDRERLVFDATGSSMVMTSYGDDGVLGTADDETGYGEIEDIDTNIIKITYYDSAAKNQVHGFELYRFLGEGSFEGKGYYTIKLIWEDYEWSESDDKDSDPTHKGAEMFNWIFAHDADFNWDGFESQPDS